MVCNNCKNMWKSILKYRHHNLSWCRALFDDKEITICWIPSLTLDGNKLVHSWDFIIWNDGQWRGQIVLLLQGLESLKGPSIHGSEKLIELICNLLQISQVYLLCRFPMRNGSSNNFPLTVDKVLWEHSSPLCMYSILFPPLLAWSSLLHMNQSITSNLKAYQSGDHVLISYLCYA